MLGRLSVSHSTGAVISTTMVNRLKPIATMMGSCGEPGAFGTSRAALIAFLASCDTGFITDTVRHARRFVHYWRLVFVLGIPVLDLVLVNAIRLRAGRPPSALPR